MADAMKDTCPECGDTIVVPCAEVTLFICWDPRLNRMEYDCPDCEVHVSKALSLTAFALLIGKTNTVVVKGGEDALTFEHVLTAMTELNSTDDIYGLLMAEEAVRPDEQANPNEEIEAEGPDD